MSTCVSWIGPTGALLPIRQPAAPLSAPVVREQATFQPAGGPARWFEARDVERSWDISMAYATPAEIGNLVALEQGVFGPGPWWWLNPWGLHTNMLAPHVASPGLRGDWSGWSLAQPGGPMTLTDGRTVATSLQSQGSHSAWVPVRRGDTVTGSVDLSGPAELRVQTGDAAGAPLRSHAGPTGPGRVSQSLVVAEGEHLVRLWVRPAPGDVVHAAGAMLHEGLDVRPWAPGEGIPRVIISGGLQRVLQMVNAKRQHADLSLTLREVA